MTKNEHPDSLPKDLIARAAAIDELEVIAALLNAYTEELMGIPKFSLQDLRNLVTTPGFDLQTSTRVVLSPGGEIAGAILVWDLASPPVHPSVFGAVHTDFRRRGIGTYLMHWAIGRARQAIDRAPEDVRVSILFTSSATHQPTVRLFEKLKIKLIRYSLLMAIELDQAPPTPSWPDGLRICTFQDYNDLRAVRRALTDAFRDHWGYVETSEEEGLARLQHRIENDAHFDPTLWVLALDGDEIAGVALCHPTTGTDPDMGFVQQLGVRRPWRRQGLALALLHHAFGEFYRRGKKRVGLGVDADSLTGATRLYEKAGMHAVQQLAMYEKELRPGKELGVQSAGH